MPIQDIIIPGPNLEAYRLVIPVGGGPSIRVGRVGLREMEVQIRIGVKALRARGVEIGGFLMGPAMDWTSNEIVIDGFVPVEIEYRYGPTFKPSDADIEMFKQRMAEAGDRVAGYFRSHLRDDSRVRAEDVRILTELFPSSDACYMPIEAGPNSPSIVNVYQVQQGMPTALMEVFPLKESGYEEPTPADVSETPVPPVEEASPVPEETAELACRTVGVAAPEPAEIDLDSTYSENSPIGNHVPNNKRRYWIAALSTLAAGTLAYAFLREPSRIPNVPRSVQAPPTAAPQSAPEPSPPAPAPATPLKATPAVIAPAPNSAPVKGSRSKASRPKKARSKKARSKKVPTTPTKPTASVR